MPVRHDASFPVMGTTAHVTIVGGHKRLVNAAEARLNTLERRWSRFLDDSELSLLNRSAGVPVIVSAETFNLISIAIDAWRMTDGRFDPTIGLTMNDAGYHRPFAELTPHIPNPRTDHTAAPTPESVVLHEVCSAIQLTPALELDLGGIAKGAAADMLASELLQAGADGCCVNIGGDMRMQGTPPRQGGWRIRLDCPGSDQSVDVHVDRGAVCTSTTRKRRWLGSSGEEHHIREPKTGGPADAGLSTVTVISATATQGEVLSKSALLAGRALAAGVIRAADATGIMITDAGEMIEFSGLGAFCAAGDRRVSA